jgi:AcrR family transcriptional regulator
MARARASVPPVTGPEPGISAAPQTTRDLLIALAAEVFSAEGYASASVRDLGRRLGVTSGALYGNFRGKADLLAAAVDARLTTDVWTLPAEITSKPLADIVAYQSEHYESRRQLMPLLLEGALAARADPEVKQRLPETLGRRVDASVRSFESRRVEERFDPDVDLAAAVKIIYSIDLGLTVLAALGIESPDPSAFAEIVRRLVEGLQSAPRMPSPPRRPAKPTPKSSKSRADTPARKAAKKASGKAPARKRVV